MCYIALNMVVMIGDAEIIHPDGLSEADDLGLGIVTRVLAVPRVKMKITLEPEAVGEAGDGR
jgi:hypothetical protein